MRPESQDVHIAIAFDQNYLHPFYALITSILKNNRGASLRFHTIVTGVADEEKEAIRRYVEASDATIAFYAVDEALIKKFVLTSQWTPAVYYRLFFPLLVPESIERLLYLDSDTIVNRPLDGLYNHFLGEHPVAAVPDVYVKVQPLLNIHVEGEYFNSGVMLIDIARWKSQGVTESAIDYLTAYPERILFVDQCALNAVLHQNWQRLPERFNLLFSYLPDDLAASQVGDYLRDKVVIHFTLHRPWDMLSRNRLGYLYFQYLKQSPVGGKAKRFANFSFGKIPAYLKIKLVHLYFDMPIVATQWKRWKQWKRNFLKQP